jgi:hypothetical protein
VKTIRELVEILSAKDPDAEFEIVVQNNPDKELHPGRIPHVVILVADGDALRLN